MASLTNKTTRKTLLQLKEAVSPTKKTVSLLEKKTLPKEEERLTEQKNQSQVLKLLVNLQPKKHKLKPHQLQTQPRDYLKKVRKKGKH